MKRTLLFLALTLAAASAGAADAPQAQGAGAAAPKAAAASSASASAAASSAASAAAAPAANAQAAAEADAAARVQLDEMRGQLRELTRKMGELSTRLGDENPRAYAWRYIGDKDRAIVGVITQDDPKGIKIVGVTPGGPAEKAGVRNGDVIVSVDGRKVDGKSRNALNEAFGELKVDQNVKLGVVRDGKNVDVNLKAVRREAWNWPRAIRVAVDHDGDVDIDDADIDIDVDIDADKIRADVDRAMRDAGKVDRADVERIRAEAQRAARLSQRDVERIRRDAMRGAQQAVRNIHFRMPWWGLNLVALNDDLSGYFGTKEGVLVLSADDEAAPALKSGDVLQAIGGDKVGSPEDAMRLLRDAPAGTDLKLSVLRRGKNLSLNMKAPEFKSLFPLPPEPPAPPAAPAPPAPPTPMAAIPAAPVAAPPAPPAPPKPPAPLRGRDD